MILLVIVIFGLVFGSFVNAYVWRFKKRKNWVSERSICPNCKHTLQAKDLVPVLSWLSLKGKCRYCKKPISAQYPAVELLTALLFALSYIFWPYSLTLLGWLAFIAWLSCLVIFMALFVYDAKWKLLPDKMILPLTIMSGVLIVLLATLQNSWLELFWSIVSGLVFFAVFWVLFQVSGGKWIGGGDVKMSFALGLIAGSIVNVFLLIFLASVIGTFLVLPLLVTKKLNARSKIPFGPLLIIATIIVFLFGSQMIAWYTKTFLFMG